jgi:predicted transcriptional regulator YheO
MRDGPRAQPSSLRDATIEILKPIGAAIQKTFGTKCEVVLHDFRKIPRSIVWIQGNVTGRRIGGSLSQIGLQMVSGGDNEPDKIAYVRSSKDGKLIKSTTILLRDLKGKVFGCLCVNLDITDLIAGRDGLDTLLGVENLEEVRFSNQVGDVLTDIMKSVQREIGRPPLVMTRAERLKFIQRLEAKGGFAIRRSVPSVARHLGLSRATVYNYLLQLDNRKRTPGRDSLEVGGKHRRRTRKAISGGKKAASFSRALS